MQASYQYAPSVASCVGIASAVGVEHTACCSHGLEPELKIGFAVTFFLVKAFFNDSKGSAYRSLSSTCRGSF